MRIFGSNELALSSSCQERENNIYIYKINLIFGIESTLTHRIKKKWMLKIEFI